MLGSDLNNPSIFATHKKKNIICSTHCKYLHADKDVFAFSM